jgi:hypothetical protein
LDRSICRGYQMVQVLLVTSLLVFINGIQFSRENHKFVLRKGAKEMSRFSLAIGESEVMPERVDSMPPSPASRSETPQFRHNTSCLRGYKRIRFQAGVSMAFSCEPDENGITGISEERAPT